MSLSSAPVNVPPTYPKDAEIRYKGWLIWAQPVKGRLWVRCQHPQEAFPGYGRPVTEAGISSAVEQVKFWIDIATKLEQETPPSLLE